MYVWGGIYLIIHGRPLLLLALGPLSLWESSQICHIYFFCSTVWRCLLLEQWPVWECKQQDACEGKLTGGKKVKRRFLFTLGPCLQPPFPFPSGVGCTGVRPWSVLFKLPVIVKGMKIRCCLFDLETGGPTPLISAGPDHLLSLSLILGQCCFFHAKLLLLFLLLDRKFVSLA